MVAEAAVKTTYAQVHAQAVRIIKGWSPRSIMYPAKKWVLPASAALLLLVVAALTPFPVPSRLGYLDARIERFQARIVTSDSSFYCGNQLAGRLKEAWQWVGFSTRVPTRLTLPVRPGSYGFLIEYSMRQERDPGAYPGAELRDASGTAIPLRSAANTRQWNGITHQAEYMSAWVLDKPPAGKSDYVFRLLAPVSGARLAEIKIGTLRWIRKTLINPPTQPTPR